MSKDVLIGIRSHRRRREGGRRSKSNCNKIGTRCEDWKRVKIWGEGKKYVGECMRLSGWGGGDVGVGVGWGGQNNANSTTEGSKRRAVRLDVSRPGVLRRFETGYGKQKEEKDVRKRQNNESFDRCFFFPFLDRGWGVRRRLGAPLSGARAP